MTMRKPERPCEYEELTQEFFDALFPALKFKARSCGYALAVHGSLKTDIDLIAVPWREAAVSQVTLAKKLQEVAKAIIGTAEIRRGDEKPTQKPYGRLAWSIHLVPPEARGPYLDLSVFPPIKEDK